MAETNAAKEPLEARVDALETAVKALERRLAAEETETHGAVPSLPAAERVRPLEADSRASHRGRPTIPVLPVDPGQWVNRLGIALLLVGAAFGFKYSIDRGWIGPAFRVLCGIGLGGALLAASQRIRTTRAGLARVLAGGGVASFYLSIYSAFQLYGLLSQGAAVASMSLVTLLAFFVASRSDDAMTATIATIGGLATPVVLSTGEGNAIGLVAYTCAVVACAGAVFARRGWRALLWTTSAGAWLLMAIAADLGEQRGGTDAAVVQAGILFVALATWWLSVVREMMSAEDPARWRPTSLGFGPEPARIPRSDWVLQPHQLALATPLLVLFLSGWTWRLLRPGQGWVALMLAGGWALAAVHLRSIPLETGRRLAATHAMGAAVMIAFAITLLLTAEVARVGLAAEAMAVLVLASRSRERQPATIGHVLFFYVSMDTFARMAGSGDGSTALGREELADLFVIATLAGAAAVRAGVERVGYLGAAQAGLLMWLLDVFEPFDDGAAYVTAAWFANAVALVVAGLRTDSPTLRTAGAAIMTLTMGKLFFYDMATVDAGLRIVTFFGFGLVLLGLGYAFPALWKRNPEAQLRGEQH